jgi:hypothetical protein
MTNIERVKFADAHVALDLDGHAGEVAKLLGAVFGAATVANQDYAGIGLTKADEGLSYEQLATVTYSDPKHAPAIKADDSIELSFRNEVMAGTGDIILSNGSDTRRIAINDASQITFSNSKFGNSLIINPTQDLIPNTHYSIRMDSGVIQDLAGNVNTSIDDPDTLSFNTTDSTPLLLYSNIGNIDRSPFDSDLPAPAELTADDDIWLDFDERMIPGSGNIILSNGSDTRTIDITDTSQVTFTNSFLQRHHY